MIDKEAQKAINGITKKYGEGAIMRLNQIPAEVPAISTGSLAVDRITGIGGVPRGRITEIYGAFGAGKTTLGQHIIAEAQREGGLGHYIDVEHAIDRVYMAACGVNIEEMLLSQPGSGTEAFDIISAMIGHADVIVVDSVAHLVHPSELEGDAKDEHVARLARLMSLNLKRILGPLALSKTALVFMNQIRYKIGVGKYENPETQPGGMALKFDASLRMKISKYHFLREGKNSVGQSCRVRVEKNKLGPPFMVAIFDLWYGKGIDRAADVFTVAKDDGVIEANSSHYYYNGENIGHGAIAAREWLLEHPEQMTEIRKAVLANKSFKSEEDEDGQPDGT